jgi:hypothetical protein
MAKVKEALSEIISHEACYGYGWLYWANGVNYFDSEACECNPYSIPADEILDWRI